MVVVVEQHKNNRFYLHGAYLKSSLQAGLSFKSGAFQQPGASTGDLAKLLQSIYAVNPDSVSKVVDKNGWPLVVYHGTLSDFSVFERKEIGRRDEGWFGRGFYFTPDFRVARMYSANKEYGKPDGKEMALFLNVRNPFVTDVVGRRPDSESAYDGTFFYDTLPTDSYRAPSEILIPESRSDAQSAIKSATDNTSAFSSENEDIRYSQPEVSPTLAADVSAALSPLEGKRETSIVRFSNTPPLFRWLGMSSGDIFTTVARLRKIDGKRHLLTAEQIIDCSNRYLSPVAVLKQGNSGIAK